MWQFSLAQVKADFYAVTSSYCFKTLSLPVVLSCSEPSTSPYLIIADSYKIHATRKLEAAETSSEEISNIYNHFLRLLGKQANETKIYLNSEDFPIIKQHQIFQYYILEADPYFDFQNSYIGRE